MSKIICDICGTSYPDTAENCPICGCSRDAAADFLGDDFTAEEATEEAKAKGGKFTNKKKKEIFDFDEVNTTLIEEEVAEEENPYEEEEEEYEERRGHNTFVVILLTVLIVALLAAAGFLFVRYFLPNMNGGETEPETTAVIETTAAPTTEADIPCQMLVLTSGTAELSKEGQYFLLHVQATPEDTTDEIIFSSADESIATVTEDGKITAVAEGETVIFITCGNIQTTCPVVVAFEEETVPPTEETTDATTDETTDETTGETVEETVAGLKEGITLKLKKTDIRLGVYYEFQLELDCDLEQNEVEWSSEHPHIAKVDENGVVTAVKDGTTAITAKYGSQEVTCIVRCTY